MIIIKSHKKSSIMQILVLTFAILSLISCSDNTESGANYLGLQITTEEQTIAVGETGNFNLQIQDAVNLFGINLEISFDSTLIEVPEEYFTLGSFWQNSDPLVVTQKESNRLCVCITLQNTSGGEGISGDGNLFGFQLIGINSGFVEISIESDFLYLIDEYGNPIEDFDLIGLQPANLIIE